MEANGTRANAKAAMVVGALGVVFGDIGTSPIYTLTVIFLLPTIVRSEGAVIGVLSLIVWTLSKPAPGSIAAAWGPSEDVSEVRAPYRAVENLREQLASQRIVMLDGHLLPQSITLSPNASGAELVGGPP